MAEMAIQSRQESTSMSPSRAMRGMLPTIVINGVLPFLLYRFLTGHGVAAVPALCAGAIFPVASIAVEWVRTRRLALYHQRRVTRLHRGQCRDEPHFR